MNLRTMKPTRPLPDAVFLLGYLFQGGLPPAAGTTCRFIEGCPDACRP
ncbi:MAG: hypothetical protein O7J95_16755 [Planctomycetota bacterium]|nr:hypothetical protein [Planctomycetota bacterium]